MSCDMIKVFLFGLSGSLNYAFNGDYGWSAMGLVFILSAMLFNIHYYGKVNPR